MLEQGGDWDNFLLLAEFTYNNSSIRALEWNRLRRSMVEGIKKPLCWFESGESVVIGPEVVQHNIEKIKVIQDNMRTSQSLQKSYHDKRRKALEFQEGDHMFLRVTLVTGVG